MLKSDHIIGRRSRCQIFSDTSLVLHLRVASAVSCCDARVGDVRLPHHLSRPPFLQLVELDELNIGVPVAQV
eukprot:2134179-Heterocapsa_arctica.AAC.1